MNTKKIVLLVIAIIVLIVVGVLAWQNGKKNANPVVTGTDGIEIFSPKPNEAVISGAKITGLVKGNGWTAFEGQTGTVKLFDNTGKELGLGILTATEDWMKIPVNFETTIYYDYPGDGDGKLVFYNENASGEAERNKTFTMPVKLQKSSSEKTTVKVFFNNSITPNSCEAVLYSQRTVPKTEAVAKTALEQLLMGPTSLEKTAGFSTSINEGVTLKSITIDDKGVAKADFSSKLQDGVAGSCKVTAIRSQITETLKQFSSVKTVVISIDGRVEDILQP